MLRPNTSDVAGNSAEERVRAFYHALTQVWGPQHWWPARTRFEVVAGAFLTQNTAWVNVERALSNLRRARALNVDGIRRTPLRELEQLIRPAGYFRQKAQRLKNFVNYLDEHYRGSLRRMFAQPTPQLRRELLALNGVGPETADSILLYAGNHPVFVVDAYTRRIVDRHGIMPAQADYEEFRALFERALGALPVASGDLPKPQLATRNSQLTTLGGAAHVPSPVSMGRRTTLVQAYNEMHALIVGVGKNYCSKAEAKCQGCPLQMFLSGNKTAPSRT